MTDGFGLFYRRWGREGAEVRRAVICIHGLPGQADQFQLLARDLVSEGSEVYAIDLRGFGNSVEQGLPRGDTRNFQRHLQDLDEVIENVCRKHQGKEIFLLGYSVGGNYAVWYAARHPGSLDGLILLAPGARIN